MHAKIHIHHPNVQADKHIQVPNTLQVKDAKTIKINNISIYVTEKALFHP